MAKLMATEAVEMSISETELLMDVNQQPRRASRVRMVTLLVGVLAACAMVSLWHDPRAVAKVRHGLFLGLDEEESEEADADAGRDESCKGVPYVKLDKVVSSNLGKQGPDKDAEEGMVYNVTAHHVGDLDVSNLQIHVHSLERFDESDEEEHHDYDKNYVPAFTTGKYVNGINGHFGTIGVKPGKSVKVRVHAYDADKKKDVHLPHGAISFFDLDGGKIKNGTLHSKEHVTVCEYTDYYLTNATEVKVTKNGSCATFTASMRGNGSDNPDDPLALTVLQKDRAVTLEFKDTHEFNFEIGATDGEMPRVFSFVFRPSLICAMTKLGDGNLIGARDENAPIVPVKSGDNEKSAAAFVTLAPVVFLLGMASSLI